MVKNEQNIFFIIIKWKYGDQALIKYSTWQFVRDIFDDTLYIYTTLFTISSKKTIKMKKNNSTSSKCL